MSKRNAPCRAAQTLVRRATSVYSGIVMETRRFWSAKVESSGHLKTYCDHMPDMDASLGARATAVLAGPLADILGLKRSLQSCREIALRHRAGCCAGDTRKEGEITTRKNRKSNRNLAPKGAATVR